MTRTKLLNSTEYVAIDTETTGLDVGWCGIIEVAAVKFSNGMPTGRFSTLVNPGMDIPAFISDMTGITNEMVEKSPTQTEAATKLIEFAGSLPILGHNVCFDIDFLEEALGTEIRNDLVDTLRISRHVFKGAKSRKLKNIFKYCVEEGFEPTINQPENYHRSEYDATIAAMCYEAMRPKLVEMYGDDPDDGYRKVVNKRHSRSIDLRTIESTADEFDESNPFFGTNICFTGKLESMTRTEAATYAANVGAHPQNNVVKDLDYLVVGGFDFCSNLNGKKSSKLKKAEDMIMKGSGIEIVSEDFFLRYVMK